MSAVLKPWLILAVIFIAGGFTGSAVTMVLSGHFAPPPGGPLAHPDDMQHMWMLRLTRQLKLTSDQQAKIEPILRDAAEQVKKIHTEEFGKERQILKASDDQIAAILTPDQQAALKQMIAEREKAFSGHMRQWGGPHDGGPDGMHFHGGGPGGPGGAYPGGPDQPPGNPPPPATPVTNAPPQ
jgi:Spy/CpxP family protein refolding chaperone